MKLYRADRILAGPQFQSGAEGGQGLLVEDGCIRAVGSARELAGEFPGAELVDCTGRFIVPACVDAHSHCFQVLMRGAADQPRDFRDWVESFLYPCVLRLDDEAIETAALLAFHQMARAGTGTIGEFHYLHNGADGPGGTRIDEIVVRAARRVGLRISLLRTLYDQQRRPGQSRFCEAPEQARDNTRALMGVISDDPLETVRPAPHSLHGASEAMIRVGAELAEEAGSVFHIHLSEQRGDLQFSRELYGTTPLRALDRMGVLSDRTVLVHGIWLEVEERARLGEIGAGLVYNPTTNMALGDGIAELPDLLRQGVCVALGTDANYSLSLFGEMRAAEYLQRVRGLAMGVVANTSVDGAAPARSAWPLYRAGTESGGRVLGLQVGRLAVGWPADFLVIDAADPSLLPASVLGGEALLSALVTTMIPETAVRDVYVEGERIVADGAVLGVSAGELAERVAALRDRGILG